MSGVLKGANSTSDEPWLELNGLCRVKFQISIVLILLSRSTFSENMTDT
jgi:hypothetical protein